VIATLALALISSLAQPAGEDPPDFSAFGATFLKERVHAASAAELPAAQLLEKHCVRVSLGLFDLSYPVWSLAQKGGFEDLRALSNAYLDTQDRWIDWLGKGEPAAAAPKADIETLRGWVKSWKPAALVKPESAADKSLFALLGASEAQ